MNLKQFIATYHDFPKKGIEFRDISPLLANGKALNYVIKKLATYAKDADVIIGPDARGFLFATPVAAFLSKSFVMVRKEGKLPGQIIRKVYDLEYRKSILEIQKDAIKPNQKVVIIDDVLATGGTTRAIVSLVQQLGAKVINVLFVVELSHLKGRLKYDGIPTHSLIKF